MVPQVLGSAAIAPSMMRLVRSHQPLRGTKIIRVRMPSQSPHMTLAQQRPLASLVMAANIHTLPERDHSRRERWEVCKAFQSRTSSLALALLKYESKSVMRFRQMSGNITSNLVWTRLKDSMLG